MNRKGDVRMQEMAFVLLAIVLLAAIVFVFSMKLQSSSLKSEAEQLSQKRTLSLRDKIAAMPELKCARISGIDQDKAEILGRYGLKDQFQGLSAARIVRVYPSGEDISLYNSGKPGNYSQSTFVNLCRQEAIGENFAYNCGLALLVVST